MLPWSSRIMLINLGGHPSPNSPESFSINRVKSFYKINKCHIQRLVLFLWFLLHLSCTKDQVCCTSIGSKFTLGFGQSCLSYGKESKKSWIFPALKAVIFLVSFHIELSLLFKYSDDRGVTQICGNRFGAPYFRNKPMGVVDHFKKFSRNSIRSSSFVVFLAD